MKKRNSAKDFIKAWQASSSCLEVADKLGLKVASARSTAGRLRGLGVKLKAYKKGRRKQTEAEAKISMAEIAKRIEGLKKLAKSLNGKE